MRTIREEVVLRFQAGKTYTQIARSLHISRGTVGGHLKLWRRDNDMIGHVVNVWTQEEDAQLLARRRRCESLTEISRALSRTPFAVKSRLLRFSSPSSADVEHRRTMEVAEERLLSALAHAFSRGEHLPQKARAA